MATLGLGFGGAVFLAFFTHWHEAVVFHQAAHPSSLVGNILVPLTLSLFFLFTALGNPLLRRFLPRLALERRHLLCVLALWVLAGLVAYTLLGPALNQAGIAFNPSKETQEMKRLGVLKYLEPSTHLGAEDARTYYFGLGQGMEFTRFSSIPWRAWVGPLGFIVPLLVAFVVMASAIVRMVHRQWSRHELLTYPFADFLRGFVEIEPGRAFPPILRDRLFWVGFGLIAFVLFINGMRLWFREMIEIPLSWSQIHLLKEFPFLSKYCGSEGYSLLRGFAFPFMVSIAVLLPTEVSLTGWLGWILFVLGSGAWFLSTGDPLQAVPMQHGMYLAMGAMILYIGRREYFSILRHAVRFAPPDDHGLRGAVTACRLFVLAAFLATWLLARTGLGWVIAPFLVGCLSLAFLLAARITAEVGIPFLPGFSLGFLAIPLKVLGPAAFGPKGLTFLATLPLAATGGDHANSVEAQETSRRKLEEEEAPGFPGRFTMILVVGLLVFLAAGTAFILRDNYSFGARQEESYSNTLYSGAPNLQLPGLASVGSDIGRLQAESGDGAHPEPPGLALLRSAKSEPKYWRFFSVGAILVGGCALLRLRFPGWPFHPLPLLLLGTWTLSRLYVAFFLGWLIKVALLRIAGGRVFARSKPFFFGVIAGSVVMSGIWIIVGVVYYLTRHIVPPVVNFFI